MSYAVLVGGAD